MRYFISVLDSWFQRDILKHLNNEYSLHFRALSGIIRGIEKTLLLDKIYDCSEVYKAFGTGAAITLFSSFFPGASTVASMSSRSAYYGVRTANAFYNLAARDVVLQLFKVLPWLKCTY